MKKHISATFLSLLFSIVVLHAQTNEPIVIGHKHFIQSKVLNEEREYWISLPHSYDNESTEYKKYPLLVLLDGHIHFSATTGMVNYRSIGNTDKRELPEMIIVAVLNVNRERDFTPDKIITKRKNDTGGGDNFLKFLETELIPKLDQEYRTIPYRILVGHSLGGLLAAHTYMKENTLFNSFISIDPSFGTWDVKTMDEKIAKIKPGSFKRPLFLATANWGKRNLRNRDRHIRFYEALNKKCERDFLPKQKYYENKNHSSVPLPAIYDGLSYIFQGYAFPYREVNELNELVDHYNNFSNRISYKFTPPEELVNRVAYRFLRNKGDDVKKKSLDFFEFNAMNYPESFNVFDSLGEAQYLLGLKQKAMDSFKKSLELNPKNEHAKLMIDKLSH